MKEIADSAKQMGGLIDNLLAFSRMGRSAMKPQMDRLRRRWSKRSSGSLRSDSKGREITWKIDALPHDHVDRALFKQVWMNLLGNAIKYTRKRDKAKLPIGCREDKKEWEFSVKDNGAGFDMQYADKLFGIFQRLHFKEEFDGNGIGLANVRRIVSRHGGRTWAEGKLGQGATFYFTLPKLEST